jgi:DNA-binding MarR family transcriptional regulator
VYEVLIFVSGLSILTLVVAVLYSKSIREAHQKYVEAKNAVDDMILSFNRQLKRQEEQLEVSTHKIDVLSTRTELVAERLEEQNKEVRALGDKMEALSALDGALGKIDALENKVNEVALVKDTLMKRIVEMEKRRVRQKESETRIESAIPIKREKALAPLTQTELMVLEFLATEGEKTAPEIKERIGLSREHTARLMKKLYEKGYLERGASKIPFTYRLKEEMQRLLRKPEQKG